MIRQEVERFCQLKVQAAGVDWQALFSVKGIDYKGDEVREDSLKISCLPPTGPFVLCRYNFRQSPITPVRGFYQLKELSPVEFRLLLQVQLHPQVLSASSGSWNCQVRLPFDHRGVIRSHDLKCTSGSFSLADHSRSIVWNLNVRRPRGSLEANLLGELIFEAPQKPHEQQSLG
eukprot:g30379.t1